MSSEFYYNIDIKKAYQSHKNKDYLESIGIIFSNIAVTMNDMIGMLESRQNRSLEYLQISKYLYDIKLIDFELKKQLDDFRQFRNRLTHKILLQKEMITGKELDDRFQEGLTILNQITLLGNEIYADMLADHDES